MNGTVLYDDVHASHIDEAVRIRVQTVTYFSHAQGAPSRFQTRGPPFTYPRRA
jgi:hypothetical protein